MGRFAQFPFHKVLSTPPRFVFARIWNEKTQKQPHTFFRWAQQLQNCQKPEFSFDALRSHFAVSLFHFSILDYFELFLQHFPMLNATLSITQHSYEGVIMWHNMMIETFDPILKSLRVAAFPFWLKHLGVVVFFFLDQSVSCSKCKETVWHCSKMASKPVFTTQTAETFISVSNYFITTTNTRHFYLKLGCFSWL